MSDFSRSEALLGPDKMSALAEKRVILFGVGGVGSWCAEALVRTGLRHLTIVDDDIVQPSNINRQLPATVETIGRPKVEVLRERLLTINPDADITALQERYTHYSILNTQYSTVNFQLSTFNYIVDAIDSVADKADLLLRASETDAQVFSSMGAALRLDPTRVRVARFDKVEGDGLARALRNRFRKIGQWPKGKITCVYSTEPPITNDHCLTTNDQRPTTNIKGSLMPVTATFGCTLASLIIKSI